MTERVLYYHESIANGQNGGDSHAALAPIEYLHTPTSENPANLISSLGVDGLHYPVLDLDFPAYVIPSSTHGHFHLYIDKGLAWVSYERILKAMSGTLLEEGYVGSAIDRRQTCVRLPWVKKGISA